MISIQLKVSALAFLALFGQYGAMPAGSGMPGAPTPAEIEAGFNAVDTDGDGKITRDQVKQFMMSLDKDSFLTTALASNSHVSDDTMLDIAMAMVDTNGDNMVSLDEINKVVALSEGSQEDATNAALAALMKVFDKDGNGKLNVAECKDVDKKLMGGQNGEMMGFMVAMMDSNGDGELDLKEIKGMMGGGGGMMG